MGDVVRAVVYNRSGGALAEIEPEWNAISWRLNNVGRAQFSVPYSDSKCLPSILHPGNRLLIQFDNGLPDWGGVLDLPRRRTPTGITMTAYTGEALLDWMRTPKNLRFYTDAPGAIFQTLLQSQPEITAGTVDMSGTPRSTEYHYHDLLARVQDLVRLTGYDFAITPTLNGTTLEFAGQWYAQRGSDLTSRVLLVEDINVAEPVLDEQGPLSNRVYCIGEGTTWGDERLIGSALDSDSVTLYGTREYAETQTAIRQETLDANAAALVAAMAYPREMLTLTAYNRAPAAFSAYDVGDIVRVQAFLQSPDWAYDHEVRVIAREWSPDGTCRLEVERVRS